MVFRVFKIGISAKCCGSCGSSGSSGGSGGSGGGSSSSCCNSNKWLYLHDRIIVQYCKSMPITIKILNEQH